MKVDSEDCKQTKIAPCREACPAGVDVPLYIRYIREGRFDEALAVVRQSIPFPAVCGYACVHPCESRCARAQFDEPIAIRRLKRAAADYAASSSWKQKARTAPATGKKVAVIGSGPGGLTAAYYVSGLGHKVTIFEALSEAGGMLRYAIPEYRLPNDIIEKEISTVKDRGVTIKTNSRVSAPESLLSQFNAVIVATGTWYSAKANVEGGGKLLDGLAFLQETNAGHPQTVGAKVVVIGGGDTAIDAARTAIRLGSKDVTIVYRRTQAEMPADPDEIADAIEEGVSIEFLAGPVKFADRKITCVRMKLGKKDASGRPTPTPIPGSEFSMDADTVISAIGQVSNDAEFSAITREKGNIKVDGSFATNCKGVFGVGDAVTGPTSIIEAIATGRSAAAAVDKYLGGKGEISEVFVDGSLPRREPAPAGQLRPHVGTINFGTRLRSFDLVETGFMQSAAEREAHRCLGCDQITYSVKVDSEACKACGYCKDACGLGIFRKSNSFNDKGYQPMEIVKNDCVGCLRCFYACPDFAIRVEKVGACQ